MPVCTIDIKYWVLLHVWIARSPVHEQHGIFHITLEDPYYIQSPSLYNTCIQEGKEHQVTLRVNRLHL